VSFPSPARLARRHPRPEATPRARLPHRRAVGRPAPPRRIRRRRDRTGHPPAPRAPTPLLPGRNRGPPPVALRFSLTRRAGRMAGAEHGERLQGQERLTHFAALRASGVFSDPATSLSIRGWGGNPIEPRGTRA